MNYTTLITELQVTSWFYPVRGLVLKQKLIESRRYHVEMIQDSAIRSLGLTSIKILLLVALIQHRLNYNIRRRS